MKNDMSIAKVIAMFMIVGCHLSEWFGVNIVAMILNVGVEIFLFVSGYLYSDKNIGGVKSFIKKKFLKICIPTYIAFLIIALINNIIFHTSYFYMTPVYLLNLQGINFIFNNISLPVLDSLGQLWFMTIILLEIIYVFLTIFLYLLKCPQSLILSALRAFFFCGKPHISRSIFLYFLYQTWLKSW